MTNKDLQRMMLAMQSASDQMEADIDHVFDKMTLDDAYQMLTKWASAQQSQDNRQIRLAMKVACLWLMRSIEADLLDKIHNDA